MLPSLSYKLTIHVTEQPSQHSKRLGLDMHRCRQLQTIIIGIERAAKNDGMDMFEQIWVVGN